MAPAQVLHRRPVALGRVQDAARPDHGLADHGGDLVGALLEQGGEVGRIVVRHRGDIGDQRPEPLPVRRDAGQARAVGVHAVVGVPPVHDHLLPGSSEGVPVAAGELRGGVDRLGAAAREEHRAAGQRGERGDALGQVERGPVGEPLEGVVGGQPPHLGGGGVGDLAPAVAGRAVPQAAARVDVLLALLVPHERALAVVDHDLRILHDRHVGERVPEPRHRVDDTSPSNRAWPEPGTSASGCHRTPTQKRAPAISSPSTVPSWA